MAFNFNPLLVLSLLAASQAALAELHCCRINNQRVCGDILPQACAGKAYKIYDRAGNVLQEIGPPLTTEEKAAKAAAEQRKKEQDELAKEQRRKDQALLSTYSSLRDIDVAQEKSESDVRLAISNAEKQIQILQQKRKKLENDAEFYKNKPLPPDLDKNIKTADHEIKLQEDLRDLKNKEFDSIRRKYDGDRQRFTELTREIKGKAE